MPHSLRRVLLLLLACVLPFVAARAGDPSVPPSFEEGKDYVRLPTPVPTAEPGKPEVVELFSYTCPHCHAMEPAVRDWLKQKPDDVKFTRVAVVFGANWEPTARAYYVAEALGVVERVHQPLFEAIHREKRELNDVDQLAAFFAEHGVDQETFRKAYQSFQTETQLRRGKQLVQRYGVRGVPAVIVNGQYEVRSPHPFDVVNFLLSKPANADRG